jgi:hypothetical protein
MAIETFTVANTNLRSGDSVDEWEGITLAELEDIFFDTWLMIPTTITERLNANPDEHDAETVLERGKSWAKREAAKVYYSSPTT